MKVYLERGIAAAVTGNHTDELLLYSVKIFGQLMQQESQEVSAKVLKCLSLSDGPDIAFVELIEHNVFNHNYFDLMFDSSDSETDPGTIARRVEIYTNALWALSNVAVC